MDQDNVQHLLAQAERGIGQGIADLERLRVFAADLDIAGVDSGPTRAIIAGCEAAHVLLIANRDELLRAMSGL